MNFRKWFTLVEITIVVIITAILFVLLSKVYITASQLYIYQSDNKNISQDLLFFNQNLQNLADSSEIDYSKYTNLKNNLWWTWNLYLKWKDYNYKLYQQSGAIFLQKYKTWFSVDIPITRTWDSLVDKLVFKIIPYENPFKVFSDKTQQPFILVFLEIKSKYYNSATWYRNIKYSVQEWFNFRYYDN